MPPPSMTNMFFCLRVDLDYVPWDGPDATEYGHGEPAVTLRLLDLARDTGCKFHFFASSRALRAFPTSIAAVLDEGHDLDWLCKHPESPHARYVDAKMSVARFGHRFAGLAVREEWPQGASAPDGDLRFISATSGDTPAHVRLFPTAVMGDRRAMRSGLTVRKWVDELKATLRQNASRNVGTTVCVRPQVLARYDSRLTCVREVTDFASAVGLRVLSLRQALEL
ncbi:MAG: hypothetical protein ACYC96_11020 [Fimbriimonadaceae bacterium]